MRKRIQLGLVQLEREEQQDESDAACRQVDVWASVLLLEDGTLSIHPSATPERDR